MIRYSFKIFCVAFSACFCCAGSLLAEDNNPHTDKMMNEKLNLTQEWDKVFPKSDKVTHRKVSFRNRYGIMLAADLYMPRNVNEKLPAIAVSGGFPRYVASPDINTEDFCAAVDYLSTRDDMDSERIGIIGICGWGGMAVNAAAIDTRIKATVTSTMYDMSRVNANGYFDAMDADARYELRKQLNAQRTADAKSGSYALAGGVPDPLSADAPGFVKDYYDYYKTPRGYHRRSLNSNGGWNVTSALSFINMPLLAYSSEIRSAVLMIHGEKAHSRYFSEDAFRKLKGDNKELMIIPGASHVDLYDNQAGVIPFDRIGQFFLEHLK